MTGERAVAAARLWLGTPYRHRASTLGAGCDCLGLLRGVWRALYGEEPRKVPPYRASVRDPQNAGALRQAAEQFLIPADGQFAEGQFLIPADGQFAEGQVLLFTLNGMAEPKHCGILVAEDRFIHAQENLGVVEANLTDGWARRVSGRFRFP